MNPWPDRPNGKIVRAEHAEAWINGFAFRDAARQHLRNTKAEAQQAREQARKQGYEEGLAEGRRDAARLMDSATGQVQSYFDSLSDPIAALALDIVQRVLGTFEDHELVARSVTQALSELRNETRVVIRVAPANVARIDELIAGLSETSAQRVSHVEPDTSLTSTQCLLVSPVAVIDVGIESQIKTLRDALMHGDDDVVSSPE